MEDSKVNLKKMQELPIILKGRSEFSKEEEKFLREIREFEFLNTEEPGVFHKFSYGNRSKRMNFTFFHGQKYKVPRFIARHLEENCQIPKYSWKPDGFGKLHPQLVSYKPRFQMREKFSLPESEATSKPKPKVS